MNAPEPLTCLICAKGFNNKSEHARLVLKPKHVAMLLFHIVRGVWRISKSRTSHAISQGALDYPVDTLRNHQVTNLDIVETRAYHDYDPYSVTTNVANFDSVKNDAEEFQLTGGEAWEFSDETESVTQDSLTTLFPRPLRLFIPQCFAGSKSPLTQRYLLCTLRSYPVMMLRGQNPPFIHPRTIFDEPEDFGPRRKMKAGPLAVCNELLQMFTMKNRDNVVQIWRAIRMEQERLLSECRGYDYHHTLAALQAISIYFILRIFEKNEEATDFDVPLVQTMLELAVHLARLEKNRSRLNLSDWEDWILTESTIRGESLRNSRLPSGRNIWQANSKAAWLREYDMQDRRLMPHSSKSKLTYADLLDYNLKNDGGLDYWLSEIDDFGNFVMSAATLQD
ncbi:uncharacterized protein BHQ10_001972 [Talaromyces amestolkiae]|uniref:Uncharacterized protein n=1 Tax=Talaromyces amestolkiae TaxID=1196081 RepID=A0A364KQY1_TALAM|nr:uncharacterized protein BHQ10_001972 [Talaromyces amestolkiae]RAO65960.1 hypothetical protein BHQ10_001972 [Talaromyces amestolkiae]